ncbi:MAG: hypothetical protein ACRDXE_03395 [Acidimicrobiales bacterium]
MIAEVDVAGLVGRYATRVHRLAGDGQHVVSPLGAWLIVALCAPLAAGPDRDALVGVLGVDPETAAALAGRLVADPHPLVAAAAAVWTRPGWDTEALRAWKTALPAAVETGDIPSQGELDAWVRRHTLGLIVRFPVEITPQVMLLMATALATKVSWARPFDLAPGSALGPSSPWSTRLGQVLRAPVGDPRHVQFIADTAGAGMVAVHAARARDGLQVTSVAAHPDVPALEVLAAAYRIAAAEAADPGSVERRSLFDLALGDGPLWAITEEQADTAERREERCGAVLPAWSAKFVLDLGHREVGFPAAASAIAAALGIVDYRYDAVQSAVARYSRVGFEAAAVTALAVAVAMRRRVLRPGVRRVAELRFGHPFAVVAVAVDDHTRPEKRGPWHGVPVFAAWVTEPTEPEEDASPSQPRP